MSYPYDKTKLTSWTKTYWEKKGQKNAWYYYFGPIDDFNDAPPKPLLDIEIECARSCQRLPQPNQNDTVTLVILVGESFEPLLQTILAYKPERIVPVVNTFYRDRDRNSGNHRKGQKQWEELYTLIDIVLEDRGLSSDLPVEIEIEEEEEEEEPAAGVEDNPSAVFQFLQKELRDDLADPTRRVVIDITGAKKTMVAGAFLFAAYTNAEISYVDFHSYDPDKHRPYGYSCEIIKVKNPFQEWQLRDWERASQLYTQYDFEGALSVLKKKLPINLSQWEEKYKNLRTFLTVCRYWENGRLDEAKEETARLPRILHQYVPLAVEKLGDYWGEAGLSQDFLYDPNALVIYGNDELARANRLLSKNGETRRDYRAAFTRAYALHETLLKARVIALYQKGKIWVQAPEDPDLSTQRRSNDISDQWKSAGSNWFLSRMMTSAAIKILNSNRKPGKRVGYWDVDGVDMEVYLWRDRDGSPNYSLDSYLSNSHRSNRRFIKKLKDKRNLIVHTYVPVSKDDAENAIKLAKANLEDYRKRWGQWIDSSFDPAKRFEPLAFALPSWKVLKDACGLDFIPDSRPNP